MRTRKDLVCFALGIGLWLAASSAAAQASAASDVPSLLAKGHAAYLAGNAEAALMSYEEAKAAAPGQANIHFFIACALARQGRDDEAVIALQTALSVDSGKDKTLANRIGLFRGQLEERRQKWAAAATAYEDVTSRGGEPQTVVASAKTRGEILAVRARLVESYAPVRQRIADAQ